MDDQAAVKAIQDLYLVLHTSTPPSIIPLYTSASLGTQLAEEQTNLMEAVDDLQRRRCIYSMPTLEDLLNPVQEEDPAQFQYNFSSGDEEIMKVGLQLAAEGRTANNSFLLTSEENEEEEGDKSGKKDDIPTLTLVEGTDLCSKLADLSLKHTNAEGINALAL